MNGSPVLENCSLGGASLTGTGVKGSSCQNTGRRRGREKVKVS